MNSRCSSPPLSSRLVSPARWALLGLLAALAMPSLRAQVPSVQTDKPDYLPGETIRVAFAGGPGNAADWIGVYADGVLPGAADSPLWAYVDGTELGGTGHAEGTLTFEGGLNQGGVWKVYLFENDTYTAIAEATFTVTPPVSVAADRTLYVPGQPIVVTFEGGPGNAKDWIGIYPSAATPGPDPSTIWAYVDGTQSGGTGLAGGTITFEDGLAEPGAYTAYLLEDDGYTILARADFEVVNAADLPRVETHHFSYLPNEGIIVDFINGPGNSKDWVGIYPEDAVPGPVPSTLWQYVDGTQTGTQPLSEGTLHFGTGLPTAGDWKAYLLLDDGYTIIAETSFRIVDPTFPFVRPEKPRYAPGEPITIEFANGPGNLKDWIALYGADQVPGQVNSITWQYVGGNIEGSVTFQDGLESIGDYVVFFLLDDGYDVLASEPFTVAEPLELPARVLTVSPPDGATRVAPRVTYTATLLHDATRVVLDSIRLSLDGQPVVPTVSEEGDQVTVTYAHPQFLPSESQHTFELAFDDDADPASHTIHATDFTVTHVTTIDLPAPLYFQDFNSTPEGSLPDGWTGLSYTDTSASSPDIDFTNLDSAAYAGWTAVDAERFEGTFMTYSNPNTPAGEAADYQRVLVYQPRYIINGQLLPSLAEGRILFGNSGYRNGRSQVLYAFTPDFDLTGKSNIHVVFHSLWEQNQDSLAALEYSIDGGQTWLPVLYLIDGADVVRDFEGNIDAVATLDAEHGDVARYTDPNTFEEKGGRYGSFIGAAVSADLAPFISPRADDDSVESKRVEVHRLPQADHQAAVRFRFAHAGTDSWYWGVDNFGLYELAAGADPIVITAARTANNIELNWTGGQPPYQIQRATTLSPADWQDLGSPINDAHFTGTIEGPSAYYRIARPE